VTAEGRRQKAEGRRQKAEGRSGFKRLVQIAQTMTSVYYAYMVEYRAELLLWVLSGSLPIILMGIWMEAAQTGNFGLTPVDFARYFLAAFIVRQFTVVWVIWEFEREIIEGKLSFRCYNRLIPRGTTSFLTLRNGLPVCRLPLG
jgi:ABC-2 type transport system permease protein